jgi:hypothetical protein
MLLILQMKIFESVKNLENREICTPYRPTKKMKNLDCDKQPPLDSKPYNELSRFSSSLCNFSLFLGAQKIGRYK